MTIALHREVSTIQFYPPLEASIRMQPVCDQPVAGVVPRERFTAHDHIAIFLGKGADTVQQPALAGPQQPNSSVLLVNRSVFHSQGPSAHCEPAPEQPKADREIDKPVRD